MTSFVSSVGCTIFCFVGSGFSLRAVTLGVLNTLSQESSGHKAANRLGVTNFFAFLSATFGEIDELERLRLLGVNVWSEPPPESWTLSTILSNGKRDNGAHRQPRACT